MHAEVIVTPSHFASKKDTKAKEGRTIKSMKLGEMERTFMLCISHKAKESVKTNCVEKGTQKQESQASACLISKSIPPLAKERASTHRLKKVDEPKEKKNLAYLENDMATKVCNMCTT